uniref:Si:ch211-196h16.12 n=1 Tax=Electrophorus electricus TaxID=8005 RepID=A0A4W4EEL4_ELEEL
EEQLQKSLFTSGQLYKYSVASNILSLSLTLPASPRVAGLQAFRWFLRSEFSEENLAFWLACQDYRNTPEPKRATKALNIYSRFINSDAPQEVNLDGQTREALLGSQDEAAADVFDSAQQRIFTLMAKDSFPRFLRSSHCRDLLRAL